MTRIPVVPRGPARCRRRVGYSIDRIDARRTFSYVQTMAGSYIKTMAGLATVVLIGGIIALVRGTEAHGVTFRKQRTEPQPAPYMCGHRLRAAARNRCPTRTALCPAH